MPRCDTCAAGDGSAGRCCSKGRFGRAGAHILSGNVLEPRALNELLPNWKEQGAPLHVPAIDDRHAHAFWPGTGAPLQRMPPCSAAACQPGEGG